MFVNSTKLAGVMTRACMVSTLENLLVPPNLFLAEWLRSERRAVLAKADWTTDEYAGYGSLFTTR